MIQIRNVKKSFGKNEVLKDVSLEVKDGEVVVTRPNDLKRIKALHGLTRSLIQNMVTGVNDGYTKVLEVNGVGYRAAKQGKKLTLTLGYSHPVELEDPEGVEPLKRDPHREPVHAEGRRELGLGGDLRVDGPGAVEDQPPYLLADLVRGGRLPDS